MKLLKTLSKLPVVVVTFLLFASTKPAAAQNNNCSAMLSLSIPNTEILSATVVATFGPVPAHCWVVGVIMVSPAQT